MGIKNGYGRWGKQIEVFEAYEDWLDDPEVHEQLAEGTGGPEGRADYAYFMLTVTRHSLIEGFRRKASRWGEYMGVVTAKDFRQHTASQLNGMTGMGPVPEFDEYPRLRTSEEMAPPYSVGKHGGIYAVTYEMLVNDDTDTIINRIPTEMGRMSAAYIAQAVAALIEGNANWIDGQPFFSASARQGLPNGNMVTGSAAVPSEDNLVTQVAALRGTTDAEGFPIDIEPGKVLTRDDRTALIFRRILRSQVTGTTSPSTGSEVFDKGTYNAAQGLLSSTDPVIVEPYLKDPNDWILFADTGRAAFNIAFLRDQREPQIMIANAAMRMFGGGRQDPYTLDFDELPFKIRTVFGVSQGDPRSARLASRS